MSLPAVRGEFSVVHQKTVTCCCFTSDGKYLLCCTNEGEFNVWSIKDRSHIVSWKKHKEKVEAIGESSEKVEAIGMSSSYCAVGSHDHTCSIWETNKFSEHWDLVETLEAHEEVVLDVAISPDERFVGTASEDQTCRIWARDSYF